MIDDSLREAFRASTDAFNRRDFAAAFAGLSPDVVWHPGDWVFDSGGVIRGRDALIAFYESQTAAGGWQVDLLEVSELRHGRVLTHQRGQARGRTSGIETERESFLVWTLGEDGLVREMHEFGTREEALAAAAGPDAPY